MSYDSKPKRLTDKLTSLSDNGRRNLKMLLELVLEVFPEGLPEEQTSNTPVADAQVKRQMRAKARREKIQTALLFIGFLALYILANSIAPTSWTPEGTYISF